jgi:RNA polymerase sigma factor for flagellar operon FliA
MPPPGADADPVPQTHEQVESLVTQHLTLVGHLAREAGARLPRHLGIDDLAGAGALALVQAAHAYDPSLGVPFARFASTRIRGAMIDQMRQRDWATRSVRSRARALATATEELARALQRQPTEAELAAASGLSEAEVRAVNHGTDRATLLSLDPLTSGEEGLGTTLEDGSPRPDEALVAAEQLGYLRDAIAELPQRLRHVVSAYYLEQRPLTEIADELGVTQSRASQLRSEGLALLKEALQTLLGDGERPRPAEPEDAEGVRGRRRAAYVAAVAQRSSLGKRADVQAYLAGSALFGDRGDHPTGP